MPQSLPAPTRNIPCGKDLAEEGEIIEDSVSSVASTPKPSKEQSNSISASADLKETCLPSSSHSDRKPSHPSEMHSRRQNVTDDRSVTRHRSRSRDSKRPRYPENDRHSYSSRDHCDSHRDSLSRRSVREIEQSKSSRSYPRHDSRSRAHERDIRRPSKDDILRRPNNDNHRSREAPKSILKALSAEKYCILGFFANRSENLRSKRR